MEKVTWLTKSLLKISPRLGIRYLARKQGVKRVIFDKIHDIFTGTKRVDIKPLAGGSRGFILILDGETALYFYQNDDHFRYDGFEMGSYEPGDVTIFDTVKNKSDK